MQHRMLLTPFVIAAIGLMPLVASAQAAPAASPAAPAAAPAAPAAAAPVLMCRAARVAETATAEVIVTHAQLVCRPVNMTTVRAGPNMSSAKTAADADKMWKDFIEREVNPL
jgi:hypothetical protein